MRAEVVHKSAEDLSLVGTVAGVTANDRFTVGEVSLGYIREVLQMRGATLGIGGMGTLNVVPAALTSAYGSRTPKGAVLFVRIRPSYPKTGTADMPGMKM